MISQHQGQHGLGDGWRTQSYARIVPAGHSHSCRLAGRVDAGHLLRNTRGGLEGKARAYRLTTRDAAENAAGVIAGKAVRRDGIAMGAAALRHYFKTVTDGDCLDGG